MMKITSSSIALAVALKIDLNWCECGVGIT